MTNSGEIGVNGAKLHTDISGALIWPGKRVLVVADLHLEKGSSYHRATGRMLPPYDSTATLDRLRAVLDRHRPETVICLGDSFHDRRAPTRLSAADGEMLRAMTDAHDWVWIAGNHDPVPSDVFGGRVLEELVLGGLVFRHEALANGVAVHGEVSGHYHPKASVRVRGRRVSARCFAGDGRRLVMPAFGAYTGGLNVLDPAIRGLFGRHGRAHILGRNAVYAYALDSLST